MTGSAVPVRAAGPGPRRPGSTTGRRSPHSRPRSGSGRNRRRFRLIRKVALAVLEGGDAATALGHRWRHPRYWWLRPASSGVARSACGRVDELAEDQRAVAVGSQLARQLAEQARMAPAGNQLQRDQATRIAGGAAQPIDYASRWSWALPAAGASPYSASSASFSAWRRGASWCACSAGSASTGKDRLGARGWSWHLRLGAARDEGPDQPGAACAGGPRWRSRSSAPPEALETAPACPAGPVTESA